MLLGLTVPAHWDTVEAVALGLCDLAGWTWIQGCSTRDRDSSVREHLRSAWQRPAQQMQLANATSISDSPRRRGPPADPAPPWSRTPAAPTCPLPPRPAASAPAAPDRRSPAAIKRRTLPLPVHQRERRLRSRPHAHHRPRIRHQPTGAAQPACLRQLPDVSVQEPGQATPRWCGDCHLQPTDRPTDLPRGVVSARGPRRLTTG